MAWVGDGTLAVVTTGWEELCDTKIALGRGGEKVVLGVLWEVGK